MTGFCSRQQLARAVREAHQAERRKLYALVYLERVVSPEEAVFRERILDRIKNAEGPGKTEEPICCEVCDRYGVPRE